METIVTKEHLNFQAEVKQLLKLMIHSLYSNKEIFLRELISNASDAVDKLRFEGLSDGSLYESNSDLRIRISYDTLARTITISDNGIGMSRQEVIDHIGTIAKSGTREFFNSLTGDQAKDANLIGQFGVGFYSAFIVSDKVTLFTRRGGLSPEHGVRWGDLMLMFGDESGYAEGRLHFFSWNYGPVAGIANCLFASDGCVCSGVFTATIGAAANCTVCIRDD